MSRLLVDRVAKVLASHTDRRGFLRRSAIVGSAIAVNPVTYALRPVSAYAAACQCRGPSACGSACCDGYTEFCCTLTGVNTCPAGTFFGGWWKADGTGFCAGAPALLHGLQRAARHAIRAGAAARSATATTGAPAATCSVTASAIKRYPGSPRSCAGSSRARLRG